MYAWPELHHCNCRWHSTWRYQTISSTTLSKNSTYLRLVWAFSWTQTWIFLHGSHAKAKTNCLSVNSFLSKIKLCSSKGSFMNRWEAINWINDGWRVAWPSKLNLFDINLLAIWYDDVIKWKRFPRYRPFVRGIHRSPVNSPRKCQ